MTDTGVDLFIYCCCARDSVEFATDGNTSFSFPRALASAAALFEPDCCQIAAAAAAVIEAFAATETVAFVAASQRHFAALYDCSCH